MDALKTFNYVNRKQKSVWSNVFWYVKVCIFWNFIQYPIHWDKKQMLKKKFLLAKLTLQRILSFSFCELQLIRILLLIYDFYMNWSTRFVSLKCAWDFPFLIPFRFCWSFYFCSAKKVDSSKVKMIEKSHPFCSQTSDF